jgi:hypothetical protein
VDGGGLGEGDVAGVPAGVFGAAAEPPSCFLPVLVRGVVAGEAVTAGGVSEAWFADGLAGGLVDALLEEADALAGRVEATPSSGADALVGASEDEGELPWKRNAPVAPASSVATTAIGAQRTLPVGTW